MRVFLVEDSQMLRERLRALVSTIAGAIVVGEAVAADEAVAAIRQASPDAVILDLHLSRGNGFDILRALGHASPAVAFFVLTGHPLSGYRDVALRLGAKAFFDKSADIERLREALAACATR